MKLLLKATLVIFIYTGLAMSCDKDDDDNNQQQNGDTQQIENTAENGEWRITYYYDSDQVETDNFDGYTFTFNDNGALVAVNGSTTVTGTWSVTDSNSSDDDGGSSDVDFNIFFASPNNFEELSDDWDIISVSNSKIELTDVSGGNGGTDFLTFEKL
jgi:hypothetical protein